MLYIERTYNGSTMDHEAAGDNGGNTSSQEQVQGAPAKRTGVDPRNPKTPNERDESAQPTPSTRKEDAPKSDRQINLAHEDISNGLIDSDRRGIPDDVPHEGQ
jgi:hypothetical protein